MAHSLIKYDGRSMLIKDAVLELLLNEMGARLKLIHGSLEHQQPLFEAYREWVEIYATMPPGLKDFQLDPWFDDITRRQFLGVLDHLEKNSSNPYLRESCGRLTGMILALEEP
jgi:hypothetical protein